LVLPISGPFHVDQMVVPTTWPGTSEVGNPYATKRRLTTWYRQRPPYDRPLEFDCLRREVVISSPNWAVYQAANTTSGGYFQAPDFSGLNRELIWALNGAYEKFRSAVGESASWLVSLAERRETMSLMTNLLTRMVGFTSALRKYQWTKALYWLVGENQQLIKKGQRVIAAGGLRKRSKDFANNYLQFHFGLAPMYSDIYSTINLLQQPLKDVVVTSRQKVAVSKTGSDFDKESYYDGGFVVCRMGCQVSIANPNLYLANQLGLLNPAAAALDLVRYSFVFDWFFNLQQVLTAWTDFAGLSISRGFTTFMSKVYRTWTYTHPTLPGQGVTSCTVVSRRLGIQGPIFAIRKPWHLSPRRGLAAISLLLQKLKV